MNKNNYQEKRSSEEERNIPNRSYNSSNPDISFSYDDYEKLPNFDLGFKAVPFKELWYDLDGIPIQKLKYTPLPPMLADSMAYRQPGKKNRSGSVPGLGSRKTSMPNLSNTFLRRKNTKKPRTGKSMKNAEKRKTRLTRRFKSTLNRKKKPKEPVGITKPHKLKGMRTLTEVENISDDEETVEPIALKPELVPPKSTILPVKSKGFIPPPMLKNVTPEVNLPIKYNPETVKSKHKLLEVRNRPNLTSSSKETNSVRVSLVGVQLVDKKKNNSSQSLKPNSRRKNHITNALGSTESFTSSSGRVSLKNVRLVESVKDSESVTVTGSVASENRTVYEEEIPEVDELDV